MNKTFTGRLSKQYFFHCYAMQQQQAHKHADRTRIDADQRNIGCEQPRSDEEQRHFNGDQARTNSDQRNID